jgi:hypothetical protein
VGLTGLQRGDALDNETLEAQQLEAPPRGVLPGQLLNNGPFAGTKMGEGSSHAGVLTGRNDPNVLGGRNKSVAEAQAKGGKAAQVKAHDTGRTEAG